MDCPACGHQLRDDIALSKCYWCGTLTVFPLYKRPQPV